MKMSKRELRLRVLASLASTVVLVGLIAIGYGLDRWAMLYVRL